MQSLKEAQNIWSPRCFCQTHQDLREGSA